MDDELRPAVTKLVTDMTVSKTLSEESLIDKLLELFAAQRRTLLAEAKAAYESKVQDFAAETYINDKIMAWAKARKSPYVGLEGSGYYSAQDDLIELVSKWRQEAELRKLADGGDNGEIRVDTYD